MASEPLGKTIMSGPTKAQLDQIYRNTHSDYKGLSEDGVRRFWFAGGATCLVALEDLTPEEVSKRLPRSRE
ncbi:hypothetical protein TOC8171_40360 [Pseudomonas syringae]